MFPLSGPQLPAVDDLPRPLYFEVPQPVPAPLTGRGWVWHEVRETITSQLPTNKVRLHQEKSDDHKDYIFREF